MACFQRSKYCSRSRTSSPRAGCFLQCLFVAYDEMLCCYTHVFTDQSFSCLRESVGPWASMDIVYSVYFKTDKSEAVMLLGFYIYRKTIIHI